MAKTIKETLLGTLVHGEEILENIRVNRSISPERKENSLHRVT